VTTYTLADIRTWAEGGKTDPQLSAVLDAVILLAYLAEREQQTREWLEGLVAHVTEREAKAPDQEKAEALCGKAAPGGYPAKCHKKAGHSGCCGNGRYGW
jgi:hypothetical protein